MGLNIVLPVSGIARWFTPSRRRKDWMLSVGFRETVSASTRRHRNRGLGSTRPTENNPRVWLGSLPLVFLLSCQLQPQIEPTKLFSDADPRLTIEFEGRPIPDASTFVVDDDGFIIVLDPYQVRIDEYREDGQFVRTLADHGIEEFSFSAMAIGPNGVLYVASPHFLITIDRRSGETRHVRLPFEADNVANILVSSQSWLYLSLYQKDGTWELVQYDPSSQVGRTIHEDKGRRLPAGVSGVLNYWVLRPAESPNGSVLVPDQTRYLIYEYVDGKLVRTMDRPFPPEPIKERDLLLKVAQHRYPVTSLWDLPAELRYFPPIVGLKTTSQGNTMVFTSFRNTDMKFRIDLYDRNLTYLGSDYLYNAIRLVPFHATNEKIYVADLGFGADAGSLMLSRFEAPRIPQRVLAYGSNY